VAANWKSLAENYHECYHCPSIHPELCVVSPPSSGGNYPASGPWLGGWLELRDGAETMALDGVSLGVPLRGLDGPALRTVSYLNVFPNVLLSLHPDYVMTHLLVPRARAVLAARAAGRQARRPPRRRPRRPGAAGTCPWA